jgi:hypothetical protein
MGDKSSSENDEDDKCFISQDSLVKCHVKRGNMKKLYIIMSLLYSANTETNRFSIGMKTK